MRKKIENWITKKVVKLALWILEKIGENLPNSNSQK